MKKKLNVYFSANLVDENIVRFLKDEFEIQIINISLNEINNPKQETLNTLKTIDLIIFTGGEDVDPAYYGEEVGKYTHINKKRDVLEFNFLHSKKLPSSIIKQIPKLGICRGAQLLTIYNGGKLIQHVEGHKNNNQIIDIELPYGIKTIEISSDHHQMMFPFDLNKENYELIGFSQNFQSNTYLNSKNEEIKLPSNFLEPEIVYYSNKNSLCIQGHPEWCIGSNSSLECIKLIKKYLLKDKDIKIEKSQDDFPEGPFNLGRNHIHTDGLLYKFDGEKFVRAEEFHTIKNNQKKSSSNTSNYTWSTKSSDVYDEIEIPSDLEQLEEKLEATPLMPLQTEEEFFNKYYSQSLEELYEDGKKNNK